MRHVCRKTSTCCTGGDELRLVPGDASLLDNVWSDGLTKNNMYQMIRLHTSVFKWQGEAQLFSSRQHVSFETIFFACKKKCCIGDGFCVCWYRHVSVRSLETSIYAKSVDMAKLQCGQWLRVPHVNIHKLDAFGDFARACACCQLSTRLAEQHRRLFKLTWCARHLFGHDETDCQSRIPYVNHSRTCSPFSIHPPVHVTKASCSRKARPENVRSGVGIVQHSVSTRSDPVVVGAMRSARSLGDLVCSQSALQIGCWLAGL